VGAATVGGAFGVAARDSVDVELAEGAASVAGCRLQPANTTSGIRAVQI
jgi:hypothetical protein